MENQAHDPRANTMLGGHQQKPPNKRRRTAYGSGNVRMCPHCGRTFKRTEHLERHVRTHTKEKPFVCHCGAAFARRDLLTRHHRVALHGEESGAETSPTEAPEPGLGLRPEHGGAAEADLAAAVSLSGLSVDPWANQQLPPAIGPPLEEQGRRNGYVDTRPYGQGLLSPQLFDGGRP